jgi:hypothetical protein
MVAGAGRVDDNRADVPVYDGLTAKQIPYLA